MGKRERQRLAAQAASAPAAEQPTGSADVSSSSAQFAQLTEMADLLLTSGELDLYSNTKEQLERYAALMLPKEDAAPQAGGDGDDEGDMFAGVWAVCTELAMKAMHVAISILSLCRVLVAFMFQGVGS